MTKLFVSRLLGEKDLHRSFSELLPCFVPKKLERSCQGKVPIRQEGYKLLLEDLVLKVLPEVLLKLIVLLILIPKLLVVQAPDMEAHGV